MAGSSGSPVLLLHEMPGLTQECLRLAKRLEGDGFQVFVPLMFGEFGKRSKLNTFTSVRPGRFVPLDRKEIGPIEAASAALCDELEERTGERVVVIGNCLSGNLALSLMESDSVKAGVVCQPALPVAVPVLRHVDCWERALAVGPGRLARIVDITTGKPGKRLLGFQYAKDKLSSSLKFAEIHTLLGDRFEAWVFCSDTDRGLLPSWANHVRALKSCGHSTLTNGEDRRAVDAAYAVLLEFLEETRSL